METNEIKTKIEKARERLPEASRKAIDAIDWKSIIFGMKDEKKFSFSQIEALGTQTDLLLSGLLNSVNYPKELEKSMNISAEEANKLVSEMNEKIFKKIREELIKNIDASNTKSIPKKPQVVEGEEIESREELLRGIENPPKTPSILNQKLSGAFHIPATKTEHSVQNLTKGSGEEKIKIPKADPYRMPIE